ncbi:MAG: C2 family cysteine protease [Betaproteobacteria bacterium]
MSWAPNPFALAERILDKPLTSTDWATATEYLRTAFNVEPAQLFEGVNDQPALLEALQELSDAVTSPRKLDEVMQLPIVKRVKELFKLSDEAMMRLLPYVVPLIDVDLAHPGAGVGGGPHPHGPAGRYHPAGPIITGDVSYLDPKQGSVADCYLVSSMISLAWTMQVAWSARITTAWHEAPSRGMDFAFFQNKSKTFPAVSVSEFLPDDANGKVYTIGRDGSEAWPGIIEKAFVIQETAPAKEPKPADYKLINNDMEPQEACAMLVAGTQHSRGAPTSATPRRSGMVSQRCDSRGATTVPTMAWTYPPKSKTGGLDLAPGFKPALMGVARDHAYAVLGTLEGVSSAGVPGSYIVLRNPWGTAPQPAVFAVGNWSKGVNGREDVVLNSDGVFAIEESVFDICFMTVGWVEP